MIRPLYDNEDFMSLLRPGYLSVLSLALLLCVCSGDLVGAIDSLTDLINKTSELFNSRMIELLNLRAEWHYRLGEYNSSRCDCNRVIKYDSGNVEANTRKVKCLFGLKQYQLAEQWIQQLTQSTSIPGPYSSLVLLQKRTQLEQAGVYDMDAILEECAQLSIGDSDEYVRLSPHGDYIHPDIQCVPIPGKGYGLRMNAVIPNKHTLIVGGKAIVVHLVTDPTTELEMLKRKLNDQPDLILQVQRLVSKPRYADKRKLLVKQMNPIQLMSRPISMKPKSDTPQLKYFSDQQLQTSLDVNGFGSSDNSNLQFLPSFVNHSCLPNCDITFIGDLFFIDTERPIPSGSELTISYLEDGKLLPFSKRRAKLSTWFDCCDCELCAPFYKYPELVQLENKLAETTAMIKSTNQAADTITPNQLLTQLKVLDEVTESWVDAIRDRINQSASPKESISDSSSTDSIADSDSFELSDSPLSLSLVKPYRLQRLLIQQLIQHPKSRLTNKQIRLWQSCQSQSWNKLKPILETYLD